MKPRITKIFMRVTRFLLGKKEAQNQSFGSYVFSGDIEYLEKKEA